MRMYIHHIILYRTTQSSFLSPTSLQSPSFLPLSTPTITTPNSFHCTTNRFLGVNNERDMLLAVKSGATAVLTDRVNWAVPFIKNNALRFQDIAT